MKNQIPRYRLGWRRRSKNSPRDSRRTGGQCSDVGVHARAFEAQRLHKSNLGTNPKIWEQNGNNNVDSGSLRGFWWRPGPCKAMISLTSEKWHGRGRRFDPDQVHHLFNYLQIPRFSVWCHLMSKRFDIFQIEKRSAPRAPRLLSPSAQTLISSSTPH